MSKTTMKIIITAPDGTVFEQFQIRAMGGSITPEGFEGKAMNSLSSKIRDSLEMRFEVAEIGEAFAEDEED